MPVYRYTNFALSILTEGVGDDDTVLKIRMEDEDKFPVIGAGERFFATIWDRVNEPEIVEVTARTGELLTVIRGADDSAASVWLAGTPIRVAMTAGLFEALRASTLTYALTGIADGDILVWDAADLRFENVPLDIVAVAGLQTALDDLAADILSHTHTAAQIDSGDPTFDTVQSTDPVTLADAYNLNNIATVGVFKVLNPTNGPDTGEWIIHNLKFDSTSMIQFAYVADGADFIGHVRVKSGGTWGDWGALPASDHTHDDRYYTEVESDGRFGGLAAAANVWSGQNDFNRTSGNKWMIRAFTTGLVNYAGFRHYSGNKITLEMWKKDGTKSVNIAPEDSIAEFTGLNLSANNVAGNGFTGSSFLGADGVLAGSTGLVPAPAATDNAKYLRGDGTWAKSDDKIYKTTDTDRNTTIIVADDPDLTFPVGANKNYAFEFMIFFNSVAAADFKWALDFPAAPDSLYALVEPDPGGEAITDNRHAYFITTAGPTGSILDLGGTAGTLRITGVYKNGPNAGDLTFQWAQVTSNAGNTTVRLGSSVSYTEVA